MRNSLKIAKWEIKRNLKNKSFLISLFSTPLIFALFAFIPTLFDSDEKQEQVHVHIYDQLNVFNQIEEAVIQSELNWELQETDADLEEMQSRAADSEQAAFLPLTEEALEQGKVDVYLSEDVPENFLYELGLVENILRQVQIERLGLTPEQMESVMNEIAIVPVEEEEASGPSAAGPAPEEGEPFERLAPGIFAGIILFSIVMTGMLIFTSGSQEKKEKVVELVLSSVTPGELMQGKIIGYFVLGLTQVIVWILLALPIALWKIDLPLLQYLFVPETLLLLLIAVAGYLLFASIFVAIGATVEDMNGTSNFQAMIIMLPFLPFLFIGPVLSDPSGLVAKITSYVPFTSPAILILRLSVLEEWPWMEVLIAIAILVASIWLLMKLAGKVFKVGILMYGKNATPKEIWKWMWS